MAATTTRSSNRVARAFANLKVNTKILSILGIASLVALTVGILGVVKLGEVAGPATPSPCVRSATPSWCRRPRRPTPR
jgi:hypothetical protein